MSRNLATQAGLETLLIYDAPAEPREESGIIYVLTNEAMPNLIKIGRTSGDGVERRVAELSRATGVPLPFRVAVARRVADATALEQALHLAFHPDRVNPAREFFAVDASRAIAIIRVFPGTDITPATEAAAERAVETAEPGSIAAERRFSRRRPPLNFELMGIPVGTELRHKDTGAIAVVSGPKKVLLRGEEVSLTKAQRLVSGAEYDVQPGRYWLCNGRSIAETYEETFPWSQYAGTGAPPEE